MLIETMKVKAKVKRVCILRVMVYSNPDGVDTYEEGGLVIVAGPDNCSSLICVKR